MDQQQQTTFLNKFQKYNPSPARRDLLASSEWIGMRYKRDPLRVEVAAARRSGTSLRGYPFHSRSRRSSFPSGGVAADSSRRTPYPPAASSICPH